MEELIGYIILVEKNRIVMRFDRDSDTSLELKFKNKKLLLEQKNMIKLGLIVKLNMNTSKLYFQNIKGEWI